ncbi:MAG TPA: hypothetical protein DHV28_00885 [Ignavibacteriales bacterium]|nr:hypothetical protein [Ignavibacteriales bacterium]
MSIDVIVTDCDTKHGFAIARYLRKNGLSVCSQHNNRTNPFYFSILSRIKVVCNFRNSNGKDLFFNYIENTSPKVVIPVSNLAVKVFSDNRERIKKFSKVLLPDEKSLEIAQNKNMTFKFAEKIGIRYPKTIYDAQKIEQTIELLNQFSFPVVLKYVNINEKGVSYCKNIEEVKSILNKYKKNNMTPPIIQEYIAGTGVGFYALYKDGKCITNFMHKRIHEYPVTGGASCFAMSIYNEDLKNAGLKILDALKWNGIAMVEFKLTGSNELYLMEINPKFWGSYELSEKCGLSFANDYFDAAIGKAMTPSKYNLNIGFRWLFSELLYYRDKFFIKNKKYSTDEKPKLNKIYNDFYPDEPLIFILRIIDAIIRIIIKKTNPHSVP